MVFLRQARNISWRSARLLARATSGSWRRRSRPRSSRHHQPSSLGVDETLALWRRLGMRARPPGGGRRAANAEEEAPEDVGGRMGMADDAGPTDREHQEDCKGIDDPPLPPVDPFPTRDIDQHDGEGRRCGGVAARKPEGRPARSRPADHELDRVLDERRADQDGTPDPPVAPRHRRQHEQQDGGRQQDVHAAAIIGPARELAHHAAITPEEKLADEQIARQDPARVDGDAETEEQAQRDQADHAPARDVGASHGGIPPLSEPSLVLSRSFVNGGAASVTRSRARMCRITCHNPADANALTAAVRWRTAKGGPVTVTSEELVILVRVLAAVLVGALIGFERTFHGRPAGFRTHALVCVASPSLMLVTVYQNQWMTFLPLDAIRTDPTRMAQGIMTGIGFLCAGVIFKEGLTVRGLTTAASIWVTAAIGILLGIGVYFAATLGAAATLAILAAFRFIELRLPTEFYAHHMVRFSRDHGQGEEDVRRLIGDHGFSIANLSYHLSEGGKFFEYEMVIKSRDRRNAAALSQHLSKLSEVLEFRIDPMGD